MTEDQLNKAKALSNCRLGCWNQSGRFILQLLNKPDQEMTEKQEWYLEFLLYKHRRQLKGSGIKIPASMPPRPGTLIADQEKITLAEKLRAKFTKAHRVDVICTRIDLALLGYRAQVHSNHEMIAVLNRALEILKDYEYDFQESEGRSRAFDPRIEVFRW